MVKIVKSKPSFPNGIPRIYQEFPQWDETAPNVTPDQLKGIYRGDILYFQYNLKSDNVEKKINNNPLVLFEGIDKNGNLVGVNLMFMKQFIDPKTSQKEVNTRLIKPTIETLRRIHWDAVYDSGKRTPYLPLVRERLVKIFGKVVGANLMRYWRAYKIPKMTHVSNITVDTALAILETTRPTFITATNAL